MVAAIPFELEIAGSRQLHGLIQSSSLPGPRPTIVICHGFKGFMEWGFFPYLADLLCARGFTSVRFNFTGSGMRPGDERVTDVEAFRTATFSQDLEDLEALLSALGESVGVGLVDRSRCGLLGHSRGGAIALLAAFRGRATATVKALVTWAAVANLDRASAAEATDWRRDGFLAILNSRTGQELRVDVSVLEDLEAHRSELDIDRAAQKCRIPWLVVHGASDETVPIDEARRLTAGNHLDRELQVVAGAGHTFGARHPFDGPHPHLIEALNATQTWMRRYL